MTAVNQLLILFIIMFIGVIAKKKNVINENMEKSISSLLVKIGMPALVISSSSITYSKEILPNMLNIFLITIASYAVITAFGYINASIFKFERSTANVYISLILFGNVGFMGYPVARALYGELGVFYASIVNLVFSTIAWTYGILLYNSKVKLNFKSLANIGTTSSLLGILLFLMQIPIPRAVLSALDLTGRMTTPLSMLLIGALIANINVKELFSDWRVYWTSFIKLLVIPLTTAFILKLLNFNEMVVSISTIMAAMPSAAINVIVAKEFDVNPDFTSVGVFITTLLCIITLPFMLFFLTL